MPLSNSSQFVKSSFTKEENLSTSSPKDTKVKTGAFELMELGVSHKGARSEFSYESETARNFDENSINKAKIGVKELMADAINKAKSQVDQIKAQARKEGFDAGFLEGLGKAEIAAREDFAPALESLQNSIEDLSHFRTKMFGKVEREMVEMVVSLAKRVIHFELSTQEGAVQSMIQLGVQSVLNREQLTIKIHPEDKGYAESFRSELHYMFQDIKNISLTAHPGIKRGGCIIESNFGTIDSQIDRLDEQLDRILEMAPPEFEDGSDSSLPASDKSIDTETETESIDAETKSIDIETGSADTETEPPSDPSVP